MFQYANEIALIFYNKRLDKYEQILKQDLKTVTAYFRKWKLQLNPDKSGVAGFHLNYSMTNAEITVNFKEKCLKKIEVP